MPHNKVFVIGAGASREVNLPVGQELKSQISSLLNINGAYGSGATLKTGDRLINSALSAHANNDIKIHEQLRVEARHTAQSMPLEYSIDSFIESERENEAVKLCGKLGIVKAILDAERGSLLYATEEQRRLNIINFMNSENTWYPAFFRLMTSQCDIAEVVKNFERTTLIIFNYDRCVEHYLHTALMVKYRLSSDKAAEHLNNLKIYHPYGSVGGLPWQNEENTAAFGGEPTPAQLLSLADGIKTFTEEADEFSDDVIGMRQALAGASQIIYLGFAFNGMNMELLNPRKSGVELGPITRKKIFATRYGISESNFSYISKTLNIQFEATAYASATQVDNPKLESLEGKCADLFYVFSEALNFPH